MPVATDRRAGDQFDNRTPDAGSHKAAFIEDETSEIGPRKVGNNGPTDINTGAKSFWLVRFSPASKRSAADI